MFRVRADYSQAYRLAFSRGITFFEAPSKETLAAIVAGVLVNEKGYPTDTVVEIDGSDPMDMVLVVEDNGSWELV